MRIIKCDYCGSEIEEGGEKNIIPADNGWVVIEGSSLCARWRKDCCPRCIPSDSTRINRHQFDDMNRTNDGRRKEGNG